MSEADMSMISDEDVLRRMWQQTEDFTRKKEIRAHMYRLREERLRNLYSPEPSIGGKGGEFSSPQGHVHSFADQTFQSMKSKEVRDAASPPKEFHYLGQDLKELSNAGWNVESENKITDNGHTHIKSVQANIEGKYDVEGGQGQFAAIEQKSQAASEYHDDNTSVIKNQSAQNSAAHEEIVRQSNDGTSFSSSSTSKTSSSQFQKSSTFKQTANHTVVTQNENVKKNQNTVDNNFVEAELLSRTVKYTDDDIKVTTEVRALPDGTRVTSTQRESKRPDSHNSKLEQYSEICATIKNNSSTKTSSETIKKSANINKETNRQELVEKESESHLRSHHKNIQAQETIQKNNSFTSSDRKIENHTNESNNTENRKHLNKNINKTEITKHKNNDEYSSNITENNNTNDRHQTTYQNDYTQKRISTDLSPTHQAWASTLRSDSPSIRTSIKLSLGESNTTSYTSIRSSISPEKNYMKPSSRENSPTKVVRDYGRSSKSTAKHTDTKITNIIRTGRTEKSPTRDPEVNLKNKPAHLENNNTNKYNKPARSPSISPSRNFPRSDEKSTEPRFSVSPQRKINQNEKIVHEGNENFVTVETTDINKNSRSVLRNSRSPSPPKGPVTFHDEIDNCKTNEMFKENSKSKNVSTKQVVDYKNIVNRSERKDIENKNENLESTKINKKNRTPSPTKRSSISPNKDKHKPTSDFISTEKSTEILNMTSKTHPRKLTTPSTSPTRLSELDYQPSTGLSSPTESVSDIVYISSLPEYHSSSTEIYESTKDVTGSLINRDNTAKRPNNLNIERSPSPTKIPSLIRTTPTTPNKESLPRKSSLKKKPSSDSVSSPIDKPNVQISPTVDSNDLVEHKIIKKDNPDKTIEGKIKPPLERRETYEERCKKILGMIDDNKIEENSQNIKTDSYDLIDKESHNKHEQQSLQEIYNVEKITRGDILETKKEPEFLSKAIKSTIKTSDFIMTEKEQEILNKVQNSLRKLSPERQPSPKLSKNNNPNKLTTSLQDIDIKPTSEDKTSQNKESFVIKSNKTKTKTIDRSEETSGTKSQSVSTKKMSYEEDSSKNKNILNTQKYIIPTKKEKSNNDKKENLSKQNSTSKITNSHKVLPQTNIIDSDSKSTKNTSIKDAKVTRTASDILIKASKYPAQRNNSKPEINVNKKVKQTSTIKVDLKKAHHYKSSVNTENLNKTSTAATKTDEINVTIDDSEHAKSSRENSPDRICPTPVNIIDDLNTPRLPDNIMEPDEEFRKRTHQTIHETGSSGNIVEIIEEEDIISKTKKSRETSYNTLSTKKDKINKLTDTSKSFKDTEKNVHSDFSDANIKNDDSLLTVSEKVSKFTSKNIKNEVEPVVKINPSDDYDIETIYQDDHTKLSVNDKAIYFKETAENINVPKTKPVHKVERPDLSDVEESLKTDECLLSVSAKVNKFVKTAEQYLNESTVVDDKEQKIKEQHDKIMELVKSINVDTETDDIKDQSTKKVETHFDKLGSYAKETTSSHAKNIDVASPNLKTNEIKLVPKIPSSLKSETVKKTKALFENITSTENIKNIKSTNLNEINAVKKSPKTDSTTVLHPSVEDVTKNIDLSENLIKNEIKAQEKTEKRSTITTKSHKEQAKPFISKYPIKKPEPKINIADNSSPSPAKANINKSDNETEVIEVSTRRGSGKFGVELRRTSLEKSMTTSERRRSSTEHHQPCIEDIYDLDLLEQMLESVVGYEQRRRIRAQIRVAKKKTDSTPVINTNTYTKSVKSIINSKSPDRVVKQSVKPTLIDNKPGKDTPNGHSNGIAIDINKSHTHTKKDTTKASSPTRLSKRTPSPSIIQNQNKTNRFQEYANAYKKKVGIDRTDETVTETSYVSNEKVESKKQQSETTKTLVQKKSKENIKVQTEKRASSPEKRVKSTLANGKHPRSPSPDIKKIVPHNQSKDVTTLRDIDDTSKTNVDEKPSWLTSRNLKKTSMESRNFSKKVEMEKKYRGTSPSKAIVKPTDVITSSYGVGPVDAEGKPLFGIKALRNGASNYQVRGTMVREEYHSHNGSSPEGTISITTYSNNPEDLEKLLKSRVQPPSRLHGLAAITTTKKFGGDTGNDYKDVRTKEERTTLDQFVHNDRKMESASHDLSSSNVRESKISKEREDFIKSERRSCEKTEERKSESREEKKTVRQNSVKSLTEKYIKSASDTKTKTDRGYPKAGLILRTGTSSSNIKENIDLSLSKSDHDIGSYDDDGETYTETLIKKETTDNGTRETKTTKTVKSYSTSKEEKSFLDSSTKVTGVQDILTRMKNADIVIEDGDSNEDAEARALLNKFLGATVLMTGMKNYIVEEQHSKPKQEQIRKTVTTKSSSTSKNTSKSQNIDLEECWDERILRKLLEESTDYEQRRRIRARLRTLMAEQEACASAVTEALAAAAEEEVSNEVAGESREEKVTTVTLSATKDSSEKSESSTTTTTTSKVIESMTKPAPKPVSPFAKFRQLEKQNSLNSPNSPQTPQSPGSPGQPYFKFTDPVLQASAVTIKERLLQWCRDKTRDYENVKLENFSTSWADGLAFCALIHHFLPEAFDYTTLTSDKRRHNFTLAFKIADEKAGIYPLLDVEDMVTMRKPDWKCVFTYVQAIHRRFKDQD